MKLHYFKIAAFLLVVLLASDIQAREIIGIKPSNNNYSAGLNKTAGGCAQPTAKVNLDINNVRTMILNGGDMWWDLNSARYEIPKVIDPNQRRLNSIFSGSLWIGGLDGSNNLKVAANTYRQSGVDFFAGPLDTVASVSANRCTEYDKIWKVTRAEIEDFLKDNGKVTADMQSWPGNNMDFGTGSISHFLAPYVNVGGSLDYEPGTDYPNVLGDMALWWVYNDKGNVHTESEALAIGLELHTMAFAFTTNDEINNMTFYTTEIINRGSDYLDKCYFGQWVDPDLGNYADDYVGCDVGRSLGICYNGDDDDDGILGYGLNPPTVGVDFFKGPKDENGNPLGMGKFVYYDNDFSLYGNPQSAQHYYNYLKGIWKNNVQMTYGGNGRTPGGDTCSYMFPGTTDPAGRYNWTEKSSGNNPADRRFLQSAGPFKLLPGARNEVTVGVVWARASSGGATGSIELLKQADDKAQKLFNNNFAITDGPSTPDYSIQELDQELIINLSADTNSKYCTQKVENYSAVVKGSAGNNIIYKFQGYQIYQLKNASVSSGELNNADKARLIYQCDLKDNVDVLVNKIFDPTVTDFVKVLKVYGENKGIRHSFQVKTDAFATGNNALVNYKTYSFMIISYANASNDQNDPEQYLAGRLNNKVISVSPHKVWSINDGINNDSIAKYGDGPTMKRLEGRGNGGNSLELTQETIDEILLNNKTDFPVYKGGATPVRIKVIDPLKVPNDKFEILMLADTGNKFSQMSKVKGDSIWPSSRWQIVRQSTGEVVNSDGDISNGAEQIIAKWGISVSIKQVANPGNWKYNIDDAVSNGFIEASFEWSDKNTQWLTGLSDFDVTFASVYNWIRSGKVGENTIKSSQTNFDPYTHDYYSDFSGNIDMVDPQEVYEKALDRTFAPYRLCAYAPYTAAKGNTFGPAFNNITSINQNRLENLSSIDLVFTPDKSKWTRCVVLEEAEQTADAIGGASKLGLRKSNSVDKDGNPDGSGTGKGWFPGYAINVETGKRLNLAFGEDSHLQGENGTDMMWNPTSNVMSTVDDYPLVGGKHYIYIFSDDSVGTGTSSYIIGGYDGGNAIASMLSTGVSADQIKVYRSCMYVMMPLLAQRMKLKSVKDGIIPNEVRVRYRVNKPYQRFKTSVTANNGRPHYEFDTKNIATQTNVAAAKKGVEKINVVPNPYYGYSPSSDYEGDQIATYVKFTNLPQKCTIRIYTLNGNLVKTIKKDDNLVEARWDLNNGSNVPIASGMYIIHIDCGDLGVKVLKWMGVMRPVDLDSF